MRMLNQLQEAYNKGLENLVFVDFTNKSIAGRGNQTELELANQKACCEDVVTAINLLLRKGDYDSARERLEALGKSIDYMEHLESQIREQRRIRLYEIIGSLNERGWSAKMVKSNAHQN